MNVVLNIIRNTGRLSYHTAKDLYILMIIIVLAAITAISLMWSANVWLSPAVNVVPTLLGAILMLFASTHPKVILGTMGLGAVIQGLRDEDITQGAVQGISVLFKLFLGTMFYFTVAGAALSLIPFASFPMIFWAVVLVVMAVQSMFGFYDISAGHWTRRIVVSSAILVLIVYGAVWAFKDTGIAKWAKRTWVTNVEECLGSMRCPTETVYDLPKQVKVPAGKSGTLIASDDWSDWREFNQGSCFRIWTANPDVPDVRAKFLNKDGDEFINMDNDEYMAETVAFSVKSRLAAPVKVEYAVWPKVPGKRCRML